MYKKFFSLFTILSFILLLSSSVRAEVDAEVAYIFNTFSFLVCGFLVMWMAAGFLFLESGLVTTRSVSTIAAKNIGKFAIVSIVFYLIGYNLGYSVPEGGYVGTPSIWTDNTLWKQVTQMLRTGFFKLYLFVLLCLLYQVL